MQGTSKIILNTCILYAKIIINMMISLVSVPLILKALGPSDFGLYNLVAGVISMLAFLNASMSISTQRFLSVAIGEGNTKKLNQIYNCGVFLHILIGLCVVCGFELAFPFLFDGFLNINTERIETAKLVFQLLVVSTFFTILAIPYGAVMNAKEDMFAFSIIGICEALLKLLLALYLSYCPMDRLLFYAIGMSIIAILITFVNSIYISKKYSDFEIALTKYVNKGTLCQMLGFAGWNTLGAVAMIGRNQGVAIVINLFYGTIINASYGVANQINGVLNYFSTTFQRAINPQLMQSEGQKDRSRLIKFSYSSSKFSILVLAFFAVPLIIEMPYVLKLWLHEIPAYTIELSRLILVLSIIFQLSMGLMSAIQAVGQIREYFVAVSILILLNIPISYLFLKFGYPPYFCTISFILIEVITFAMRLIMAKQIVGISPIIFLNEVVIKAFVCIIIGAILPLILVNIIDESFFRLLLVCLLYAITFISVMWCYALSKNQKLYVKSIINNIVVKLRNFLKR